MAYVTAHSEMKMTVPVFGVHDGLDDGVLVEVPANQVGDVAFGPRLQIGIFEGAEMYDEVREKSSLVEAAAVGRGDLTAVVAAMNRAEGVDPVSVEPSAVLADDVLRAAGARWQQRFARDKIVGRVTYNTHGSFVARQESQMTAGPPYSIPPATILVG